MSDVKFMERALSLARRGLGQVSPNPAVGAVVVKDGRVVGEAFHRYQGLKHAELLACEQAGCELAGATLYVNLEPCSHQGRTPPCCDYLIEKKIERLVAAMQDPNPQVSGKGFQRLRQAGILVDVGLMGQEAATLNEGFAKLITTGIPFVTIKSAMSLDGKISGAFGCERERFTGAESNAKVQELRLQADAIAVGARTVMADDPMLTYRGPKERRRALVRVIVDPNVRICLDRKLFQDPSPIWWLRPKTNTALPAQVTVLEPGPDYASCWRAVLQRMAAEQMYHLLIEGGGDTNAGALSAGIVDKILLVYTPELIGGSRATSVIGGEGLKPPISLKRLRGYQLGQDFWIEGYLS